MAIAFPNPATVPLPSKYKDEKHPVNNCPTKVANFVAQEAGDTGTIGNACKIARGSIKLAAAAGSVPKEISDVTVSHLSSVIDTFKILTIPRNVKTIIDNSKAKEGETKSEKAQRTLKVAGATTGIAIASMTGVRLLDNFKLLKIADISKGMGITSIASAPVRAALSFPVVFSGLEILENGLTIAASSLKMHDLNQKMTKATEKTSIWNPDQPSKKSKLKPGEPIDMIAAGKLTNLPKKMEVIKTKAETVLAPLVEKTGAEYTKAKAELAKIEKKPAKTFFEKLLRTCALKKAENQVKKAARDYNKANGKFEAAKGSFNKLGTNLERWKVIEDKFRNGTLTDKDKEVLSTFKDAKEQKWQLKIKNITWDKVKEGLTLGMSIFLTIFLITSIALAIAFPVALPLGAIIGLSIGGLLISIGFTVKHFLPRFMESESWGKKPYKSVDAPELELATV